MIITISLFILRDAWDNANSEYIDSLAKEVFKAPEPKVQPPKIERPAPLKSEKPKRNVKKKKVKVKRIEAEG